jgi:hypothetical protein
VSGPRGTVAFVFTDLEGSTRLLKQLRDRYGAVLTTFSAQDGSVSSV